MNEIRFFCSMASCVEFISKQFSTATCRTTRINHRHLWPATRAAFRRLCRSQSLWKNLIYFPKAPVFNQFCRFLFEMSKMFLRQPRIFSQSFVVLFSFWTVQWNLVFRSKPTYFSPQVLVSPFSIFLKMAFNFTDIR